MQNKNIYQEYLKSCENILSRAKELIENDFGDDLVMSKDHNEVQDISAVEAIEMSNFDDYVLANFVEDKFKISIAQFDNFLEKYGLTTEKGLNLLNDIKTSFYSDFDDLMMKIVD